MSDGSDSTDRMITFSEVFRVSEFRAIFASTQLTEMGDHMSKAAVTALVYFVTDSVPLAAAAFAISYAPWVIGGPFLTTLAERLRYRAVMVTCDLLRAVTIGLVVVVAVTMLPSTTQAAAGDTVPTAVWLIIALLFVGSLIAPPALAARSAIMPLVLRGDRVTLGLAVNQTGRQATQVLGYMTGALIAIIDPAAALAVNATFYLLTAAITRWGVRDRAPVVRTDQRNLLRETREGFQIVFGTPALRVIAIVVFASMLFAIVPEGLASGWAHDLAGEDRARRGLYQGLIMIANPIGHVVAGLLIIRLLRPSVRSRLVPYFLVAAPLALVPSLMSPGIVTVVTMAFVSGLAIAGMLPTLNGIFVQILRHGYRARAFGVMNSGMQVIQGFAVFTVGAIVGLGISLPVVVGLWSAAGVVLMLVLATRWPKVEVFREAIVEATAANQAAEAAAEAAANQAAEAAARGAAPPGTATEPAARLVAPEQRGPRQPSGTMES